MFENFSKFFAQKKNVHILIAALVIVVGIMLLKKAGLYEGMREGADPVEVPNSEKRPSSIKAIPIS